VLFVIISQQIACIAIPPLVRIATNISCLPVWMLLAWNILFSTFDMFVMGSFEGYMCFMNFGSGWICGLDWVGFAFGLRFILLLDFFEIGGGRNSIFGDLCVVHWYNE